MTRFPLKQFRLFPESRDQSWAATHALESPNRMIAEVSKRLGTEVGNLMLFPVPPQVFHRLELRRIGRQILNFNAPVLATHKALDQSAAMGFVS